MANVENEFCPYKGLQPYTEADRAYFFGRERDHEIIISNLYAAPLTILYGASGVGKSSVLLASVTPELHATPRTALMVFREWQGADFVYALKQAVLGEVARSTGKTPEVSLKLPLDEFLFQVSGSLRGQIFFIFDQFEEYFLYHPPSAAEDSFDAEFARAVNRPEIHANFLLSMREDGLSKLDRFQGRIPNLLANMLRLEHLDREAAESAIRNPLKVYNRQFSASQQPVSIEDGLVEALLDQVKTGRVLTDQTGQGQTISQLRSAASGTRIETPFLQMVLTRLWEEEMAAGSRQLRSSTLNQLGGTESIARTHLDKEMAQLSDAERDVAARLFRFLVTPAGTKIAQDPSALAAWAEVPEDQTKAVLTRLSSGMRILRRVNIVKGEDRYEIFHDVLAPATLDWRRRYVQAQARAESEARLARERGRAKRLRWGVIGLLAVALVIAVLAAAAWRARGTAQIAQQRADAERIRAEAAQQRADRALDVLKGVASKDSAVQLKAVKDLEQMVENKDFPPELLPAIIEITKKDEKAYQAATTTIAKAAENNERVAEFVDLEKLPARIYMHIAAEQQRAQAKTIEARLEQRGWNVPGIEVVGVRAPASSELRYFRNEDAAAASEMVKLIQQSGGGVVRAKHVPGYEDSTKMRPKHYELWFSAQSLQEYSSPVQQRPYEQRVMPKVLQQRTTPTPRVRY